MKRWKRRNESERASDMNGFSLLFFLSVFKEWCVAISSHVVDERGLPENRVMDGMPGM